MNKNYSKTIVLFTLGVALHSHANVPDSTGLPLVKDTTTASPPVDSSKIITKETQQESPQNSTVVPSSAGLSGPTATATVLTLDEIIKEALISNPLIVEARLKWQSQKKLSAASWGDFEPNIVGSYNKSITERERRSFLEKQNDYNLALEGKTPTGATYNLGLSLKDYENSVYTIEDPNVFTGIRVSQPLLKGIWFSSPITAQKIAELDEEISFNEYRSTLMQIIKDIKEAYWHLAYTEKKYQFTTESVEIAQKILRDSEVRYKNGIMAELEYIEAQVALVNRLATQSEVKQELIEAEHAIKMFLRDNRINGFESISTNHNLLDKDPSKLMQDSIAMQVKASLKMQPSYLIKLKELNKDERVLSYHKDQFLPELNVNGTYGINGTGVDKDQAIHDMMEYKQKTASFGVQFKVPVFAGVAARNKYQAAKIKKTQTERAISAMEIEIEHLIKLLRQRISTQQKHLENTNKVLEFRKKLLDTELIKFKSGKGNMRFIYETEDNLAKAKQLNLESAKNFKTAQLNLEYITGTILSNHNLEKLVDGSPELLETAKN